MIKYKHYVIYGDPIALARSRYTRGRVYDSQKNVKLIWGLTLKNLHGQHEQFTGPLFMDVIFYLPLPQSAPAKRLDLLRGQYHIFKPDSDNLLKFIADVGSGICYKDDCIIAKQQIEKIYDDGNGPRTEFIFAEINKPRVYRDINERIEDRIY